MVEGIIPRPRPVAGFEIPQERKPVKREAVIAIEGVGINGSQTVPDRSTLEQVKGMSDEEVRRKLAELLDQKNVSHPTQILPSTANILPNSVAIVRSSVRLRWTMQSFLLATRPES